MHVRHEGRCLKKPRTAIQTSLMHSDETHHTIMVPCLQDMIRMIQAQYDNNCMFVCERVLETID
jgi:hypothetical protein